MRTHLFSTAITSKAAATAATVVLIGGGAALADTDDLEPLDEEEVVEPVDEDDDGDAYALGRADDEQQARITDFCETEDTDSPGCDDEASAEEEGGAEEDDGERSETAMRVHRALTGGADLAPDDEGFGQAVSERARSGQPGDLGKLVSRSARGEDVPEEDLELDDREHPGNAGADDEEEEEPAGTSEDGEVEIEPAEAGGPPDHAKARGRR